MEFNNELFFIAIKEIAEINLLTKPELNKIIENAFFKTFHSKIDPDAKLELVINEDAKKFELVNHSKIVVDDKTFSEEYRSLEMPLSEAIKLKPNAKVDDVISEEVDLSNDKKFSNHAKQLITQNVREKRKEAVFAKHKSLKGEMVDAEVTSSTKGHVVLQLDDGTNAFMPAKLRNLNIPLNIGEKIKVFVEDVLEESKDSQIIVSNGSPTILKRMLENEVPEISSGIVEVVAISRIAGLRAKIAVKSYDPNVDPVGAVIGSGGSRINAILGKLQGEKLDIINWSENETEFIANSISPAKVVAIIPKINTEGEEIENHKIIVTPNIHQTLAIGKMGLNARLAVELVNKRLDIISIDKAKELGMQINWNGNINDDELVRIEAGEKINNRTARKAASKDQFASKDIDVDISTFSESISQLNINESEIVDEERYEINDNTFSEEEIKEMENSFEFDEELMAFGSDDFNEEETNLENE